MDALTSVTFRDPRLLGLAAIAVLAVIWFVLREQLRRRLAERFAAERLRGISNMLRTARPWLAGFGFVLACIALAGPQLGFRTMTVETAQTNRIFALDISSSMDARDLGASRLDAAKGLLRRLVEQSTGRVGLVVFEKSPEVVSPLTTDSGAVETLLETISSGETPQAGSDLGGAILGALTSADIAADQSVSIVVASDGEDQGRLIDEAIREAQRRHVRVDTILVGTEQGATIPAGSGTLHDERGVEVVTHAHAETLKRIANETGGKFFDNPFDAASVNQLQSELTSSSGQTARELRVPVERFEWPLSAAFVLLCLAGIANRGAE